MKHFCVAMALVMLLAACEKGNIVPKGTVLSIKYKTTLYPAYTTALDSNPACMIDFDEGRVYNVQEAKDSFANIDMIVAVNTLTKEVYLFSPKVYDGAPGLPTSFSKVDFHANFWTFYDSTKYSVPSSLHKSLTFDDVGNIQDLNNFISDQVMNSYSRKLDASPAGKTYCFTTGKGKQGVLRIDQLINGPKGYLNISVFVER
ncbi:MAG: hypothetical protein U0T84_09330 [Chitinophagales bacterium]